MPYRTPADPHSRPDSEGPDTPRVADHTAVAAWLAHVDAGRIGSHLRPTAALLEAKPPTSEEHRERILANERVMRGDRQPPIW